MGKYSHGNYDGPNGIHGVPLWRLIGFVCNNTSSNCYLMMMGYIAYYLTGPVGVSRSRTAAATRLTALFAPRPLPTAGVRPRIWAARHVLRAV